MIPTMVDHLPQDPDPHATSPQRPRGAAIAWTLLVPLVATAFVAVPNLLSSRLNQNESDAIAMLKRISCAQAQCQASGVLDVDHDGNGEFAFLGELAASAVRRGGSTTIGPTLLPREFRTVLGSRVEYHGYVFQVFLPDAHQQGVAEDPAGGDAANDNGVDPQQARTLWCCYAWPKWQGWSGKRAFFVDCRGDVLSTTASALPYDGTRVPCAFGAAFAPSSHQGLGAAIAANAVGRDGNLWTVVG